MPQQHVEGLLEVWLLAGMLVALQHLSNWQTLLTACSSNLSFNTSAMLICVAWSQAIPYCEKSSLRLAVLLSWLKLLYGWDPRIAMPRQNGGQVFQAVIG